MFIRSILIEGSKMTAAFLSLRSKEQLLQPEARGPFTTLQETLPRKPIHSFKTDVLTATISRAQLQIPIQP